MKITFLEETLAVLQLRREAARLDQRVALAFKEARSCEANAVYQLGQLRDLEAKLQTQMDRRVGARGGIENRKSPRPEGVGLGPQKVRIRITR
ncbi:MAG: hypothetical protein NTW96_26745 [Planctomycetia bacterium]|nr:hypothetical protein [Planctomycetia bacterium]